MEQGKPLPEAKGEVLAAADVIDWFAEEARRAYGRVIPARAEGIYQLVIKEPVGPVAAFTPWNFPINQVVRKLSGALAAGCSIIVKAPEETPASPAELIRAFADAGVPAGVINLVYGVPAEISEYLIPHPMIRKISFTGSTVVGKQLAALAGAHMKRVTMELGGHAPGDRVRRRRYRRRRAGCWPAAKFRNAGQVCVSPTRYAGAGEGLRAVRRRLRRATPRRLKVGDGLETGTTMGPLANARRITAMETFIGDAAAEGRHRPHRRQPHRQQGQLLRADGADRRAEGGAGDERGTVRPAALIVSPFRGFDEVVAEANRLPFGLAAYAYTRSAKTANAIAAAVESGMMSINHHGLALPEMPFGGVKDSGYGSEGGSEAIEAYLNTKFVTQAGM